jgi:hypothetical protein
LAEQVEVSVDGNGQWKVAPKPRKHVFSGTPPSPTTNLNCRYNWHAIRPRTPFDCCRVPESSATSRVAACQLTGAALLPGGRQCVPIVSWSA